MNKKLSAAKVVNYLIFPNPCLSFLCGYKERGPRNAALFVCSPVSYLGSMLMGEFLHLMMVEGNF